MFASIFEDPTRFSPSCFPAYKSYSLDLRSLGAYHWDTNCRISLVVVMMQSILARVRYDSFLLEPYRRLRLYFR